MKKSELSDMIREIVKEEIATEMSNAFRFIMKEQFMNFSKNASPINESSGRREDFESYPEVRKGSDAQSSRGDFSRAAFGANYKNMIDGENSPMQSPMVGIPTTSPDGRPINIDRVDKVTLSAITKDYSSYMKKNVLKK